MSTVDAALGTNTAGAMEAVSQAVEQGIDKAVNGNAGDRGEVVGQAIWGIVEAVAGSKGAGAVAKLGKASSLGAKLKLPGSMVDELATYQKAAKEGTLVKQSTKGMRSKARSIWSEEFGDVPEGFDVDHIIQKQFGGTDDLSNLQLKKSGLNRSEGSKAYHKNKQHPQGTKFNSVELDN